MSLILAKPAAVARALVCAGCSCSLADCIPGQEVFLEIGWQVSHGQLAFFFGANRCIYD